MKIKRLFSLVSILCFSLVFTGCGEALYTMTAEEEAIITLYASKTVSKFNKNQTVGICNARVKTGELDSDYEADETNEDEEQTDEDIQNEEVAINPETGEPIDSADLADSTTDDEESVDEDDSSLGYSFTEAIGVQGVEFTCSEFDVSEDYKTSNFVLNKVSGKQYVALKITGENTTDKSVDFSEYSNRTYSLSINNGEKVSSQFTPLSNDLANYDGVLAAGETKSYVLVFLFSNSSVENISSLQLYVTSDGTTRGTTI